MKTPMDELNKSFSILKQLSETYKAIGDFDKKHLSMLQNMNICSPVIDDIVKQNMHLLSRSNSLILGDTSMIEAVSAKWNAISAICCSNITPALSRLQSALLNNSVWGISEFISSIDLAKIHTSHLSVLRALYDTEFIRSSYPRGLPSVIRGLHADTISTLSKSNKITLNAKEKQFFVTAEPNETATISETNIICSGLNLFDDIDEADLIRFQNHLSKYPSMATSHNVGDKINEIISQWKNTIDFDFESYYHARSLDEGQCPYTEDQMRQAPYGVTTQGRYNFAGQSRFYFSNKKKGAMAEIIKHSKPHSVQIVKIKPRGSIRMLDLSIDLSKPNKFLDFCRYVPDYKTYSNMHREYLIPFM